jgi:hypothetical protein
MNHVTLIAAGLPMIFVCLFIVYKKEKELIGFVRYDLAKATKSKVE